MNNYKKGIIIITVVAMFCVIIAAVKKNAGNSVKNNLVSQMLSGSEAEKAYKKDDNALSSAADKISQYFYGVPISEQEDTVLADGYRYSVTKVEVTKKKGKFEHPDWPEFQFDSHGNLINDYTYVIVDIKIKYQEEVYKELDVYLNNLTLHVFDKDGKIINAYEAVASDNPISLEKKEHFKMKLNIGDEVTRKIVFIVKDADLKGEDFILHIDNHNGKGEHIEDQQCIQLNLGEK